MYIANIFGLFLRFVYLAKFDRYTNNIPYTGKLVIKVYSAKWLIPKRMVGQTWGNYVFIRKNVLTPMSITKVEKHEFIHVWQYKTLGWWGIKFLLLYLYYSIKYGYTNNPFEIEARDKSRF